MIGFVEARTPSTMVVKEVIWPGSDKLSPPHAGCHPVCQVPVANDFRADTETEAEIGLGVAAARHTARVAHLFAVSEAVAV
jgi:hypothetical protein